MPPQLGIVFSLVRVLCLRFLDLEEKVLFSLEPLYVFMKSTLALGPGISDSPVSASGWTDLKLVLEFMTILLSLIKGLHARLKEPLAWCGCISCNSRYFFLLSLSWCSVEQVNLELNRVWQFSKRCICFIHLYVCIHSFIAGYILFFLNVFTYS